jgi:hypothetical protein
MTRHALGRHARGAALLALAAAGLAWIFTAYLDPDHLIDLLVLGDLCG